MKVLIACEKSQRVCTAFRERGHEAFSCDIEPCRGGHPEWHIQGDALEAVKGGQIKTQNWDGHYIDKWDLLIAHPPCQRLSCAGMVNLGRKNSITATKEWQIKFYKERCDAIIFFISFLLADVPKIAVENPVGYMSTHFRKPDQYLEPYMFGDPWKKKTGLWLKGLPLLQPTNIVIPRGKWVQQNKKGKPAKSEIWELCGTNKSDERAVTFEGIAKAMAEQWG